MHMYDVHYLRSTSGATPVEVFTAGGGDIDKIQRTAAS